MKRLDGRKPAQLRPIRVIKHYVKHADGSVLFEMGNTRVICAACITEEVPKWLNGKNQGWVTAEYSMLPYATHERKQRESTSGKIAGRTQEIQRLIGRSLRGIMDMQALGERTVWLDCDVIQADGGTRTASINGAYIALMLALQKIKKTGKIKSIPVHDSVAAISVGLLEKTVLLDVCYEEDSRADVDMNVVMTGSGKFIEIQGTAEHQPFGLKDMNRLLHIAKSGIRKIFQIQKQALAHSHE